MSCPVLAVWGPYWPQPVIRAIATAIMISASAASTVAVTGDASRKRPLAAARPACLPGSSLRTPRYARTVPRSLSWLTADPAAHRLRPPGRRGARPGTPFGDPHQSRLDELEAVEEPPHVRERTHVQLRRGLEVDPAVWSRSPAGSSSMVPRVMAR
jgi:hypothetical protein